MSQPKKRNRRRGPSEMPDRSALSELSRDVLGILDAPRTTACVHRMLGGAAVISIEDVLDELADLEEEGLSDSWLAPPSSGMPVEVYWIDAEIGRPAPPAPPAPTEVGDVYLVGGPRSGEVIQRGRPGAGATLPADPNVGDVYLTTGPVESIDRAWINGEPADPVELAFIDPPPPSHSLLSRDAVLEAIDTERTALAHLQSRGSRRDRAHAEFAESLLRYLRGVILDSARRRK